MQKIEFTRQQNVQAIENEINKLEVSTYETVSELLPKLFTEGKLAIDSSVYAPGDACVGRHLLYDNPHDESPFSLWIFSFSPQQKTSIHDHLYKGTVIILEGPLAEKNYKACDEDSAQIIRRIDRYRFHTNKDSLDENFIHQLKRRKGSGPGVSVSLHIYNMKAGALNIEGKWEDNRNLNIIYTKKKGDKNDIPPYEPQYSFNM